MEWVIDGVAHHDVAAVGVWEQGDSLTVLLFDHRVTCPKVEREQGRALARWAFSSPAPGAGGTGFVRAASGGGRVGEGGTLTAWSSERGELTFALAPGPIAAQGTLRFEVCGPPVVLATPSTFGPVDVTLGAHRVTLLAPEWATERTADGASFRAPGSFFGVDLSEDQPRYGTVEERFARMAEGSARDWRSRGATVEATVDGLRSWRSITTERGIRLYESLTWRRVGEGQVLSCGGNGPSEAVVSQMARSCAEAVVR